MGNFKRYRTDTIPVNGSADDIDVSIDFEYNDVIDLLEQFSPKLLEHFEETFTEDEKTELKRKFEFTFNQNTSVDYCEFYTSVDEIRDAVSNLDEEDLRYILEDNFEEYIGSNKISMAIVKIPNLNAEDEFNQFYESYKRKWNL